MDTAALRAGVVIVLVVAAGAGALGFGAYRLARSLL